METSGAASNAARLLVLVADNQASGHRPSRGVIRRIVPRSREGFRERANRRLGDKQMSSPAVQTSAEMKIQSYDFGFLKDRFEEVHSGRESFSETVNELKRFFRLAVKYDEPIAMVSDAVDKLWHTFLIFTPQYRRFCDDAFGEFIDHQPHTGDTPVPEEALTNFFNLYTREYGEPGPIWISKYPAEIVDKLKSGIVPDGFAYQWSGWTGRRRAHSR